MTFKKNITKQEIRLKFKELAADPALSDELRTDVEDILKYMEAFDNVDDVKSLPSATIDSTSNFTFALDFFILPDKVDEVTFISTPDLNLLSSFIVNPQVGTETKPFPSPKYCTLIVTENADLHCAADLLSEAWQTNSRPWVIRDVLVQECVQTRFMDLVKDRLSKLDKCSGNDAVKALNSKDFAKKNYTVVADKIVVGIPRNYVHEVAVCAPYVTWNIFRTTKEAASLYNKLNGGSAAVYSECITEAHELAKTLSAKNIWINCHGVLDSRVPYTFGNKVYGSELFHYTEQPPTVRGEPGKNKPFEKSFFAENYLFTVVSEPRVVAQTGKLSVKLAMLYNFNYKTIIVRFGQTFAN